MILPDCSNNGVTLSSNKATVTGKSELSRSIQYRTSETIGRQSTMRLPRLSKFAAVTILVLMVSFPIIPQERTQPTSSNHPNSSLTEIRDKQRALLLVFRSGILDAGDGERGIIDQVLKADPQPRGRYLWVYGQLAKKLNSYIRKYKSLTAARELSDADYVIYFNLIEYRRILNVTYPYGELFVIVKGSPETQTKPRVIWRAKKILWAGDAISDLIKELKSVRGES